VLSTRQFAARHAEFERLGVQLVQVFKSPVAALAPLGAGSGRVPFDVVADPERLAYRLYGIPGSLLSLWSLFTRRGLARALEARRAGLRPRRRDALRDGVGGSPADFLIGPDGGILRAHYGAHFVDSLPPDAALAWITEVQGSASATK
jgi:hypothetical protein